MATTSNSAPARPSLVFRTFQANILLLAVEGKTMAEQQKDKTWKCLCNALMWATDGVISGQFLFDLDPKKSIDAAISSKDDSPSRNVWLEKTEKEIDSFLSAVQEKNHEGCYGEREVICLNLIHQLVLSFKQGAYSKRVNPLFTLAHDQTAQNKTLDIDQIIISSMRVHR